jgi:2-polyprenyl-3-methyl-5-hydroxy-6-metoxy-1,4-benzoquinol methylase
MTLKEHWEHVHATKATDAVSWFQPHAERSLRLIRESVVPPSAAIIDIGGGTSTLVDDLLREGYSDLTVLDLSAAALAKAKERIGERASRVTWIEADITEAVLPEAAYDVWHDRAVFHFLTDPKQRRAYVRAAIGSVKPGGHLIVATFADDGPTKCSDLPVQRYNAEALHAEFGEVFALIRHENEAHQTPFGTVQQFVYCLFQRT